MNASSVELGQVWEHLPMRRSEKLSRLLLVVSEPYDHIVWDAPDEDNVSWAGNHPQVEVVDLETGELLRINVSRLLEGNCRLLLAAPGETGNSSKSFDLELPCGLPQLSEA